MRNEETKGKVCSGRERESSALLLSCSSKQHAGTRAVHIWKHASAWNTSRVGDRVPFDGTRRVLFMGPVCLLYFYIERTWEDDDTLRDTWNNVITCAYPESEDP